MKRRTVGLIAAAGIVVAGALFLAFRDGGGVPVEAQPAARKAAFKSVVTASGQIVAQRYADIGSSVMGRLVQLRVKEGDAVTAGQVLARIDAIQAAASASAANSRVQAAEADLRATADQLQAAQADLDAAKARAQEAQLEPAAGRGTSARTGSCRPPTSTARSPTPRPPTPRCASAEAALRRLQQGRESTQRKLAETRADATRVADILAKTDILAPIDGVVTRLPVQEGEMVVMGIQDQPGTTLMTISDLARHRRRGEGGGGGRPARRSSNQSATRHARGRPRRRPSRATSSRLARAPCRLPEPGAAAREFRVKVRLDCRRSALAPGPDVRRRDPDGRAPERARRPAAGGRDAGRHGRPRARGRVRRDGRTVRFQPVTTGLIGGLDIEVSGVDDGDARRDRPLPGAPRPAGRTGGARPGLAMTKRSRSTASRPPARSTARIPAASAVTLKDGRVAAIDGGHENPVTGGYICGKVRRFADRVYGADRLLRPGFRLGPPGSGEFSWVSWDEALERVVAAMPDARDRWGAESVLPYCYGGSNGLLTQDTTDARLFRRFGASRLARTLCAATTGAANQAPLRQDAVGHVRGLRRTRS